METRFGRSFSDVYVHTGADAAASARQLQARAYTVGLDVVFSAGAYEPSTMAGRQLIAHELAHVEQQRAGSAGRSWGGHASAEREARGVSAIVAAGGRATVRQGAPHVAQRQPEGDTQSGLTWSPSPEYQLQLDPELQREMLRMYIRWWLGTTLVEGDAPTQLPEPGAPDEYEALPDAGTSSGPAVPPVGPTFPMPSQLFAPLPPDPLWVPPDYGSLYGSHLGRGVPGGDPRDQDLLVQLYRDRLRIAQGLPDLRAIAPSFIRPLIPMTWRRDIAGALTSAAAGSGLARDYMTPIEVSDRAWQSMTGASTTIIPFPSISFDLFGGGRF